ncbi:hypothetical protein Egran_01550 [Elaphomyces granulatus]|uniref:Carrier domain-containing protein n=1 Tax=Elaphomyces granulatus TaxID=519963 RepID=A0A232M2S0_9EURO|nr:hypothetical protein Egran_01550 [Elaphomyces granulatus]
MEEVELCLFPALNDRQQGVKELSSVEVDSQAVRSAFGSCERLGISFNVLLEAIWSLVLYHFTGLDNVRFASEVVVVSSSGALALDSVLCSIDISKVTAVSELLDSGGERKKSRTSSPITEDLNGSFNSGIIVKYLANDNTKEHPLIGSESVDYEAFSTSPEVSLEAEVGGQLPRLLLRYCTSLLCTSQSQNVADTVAQVMTSIIHDPQQSLQELELCGPRQLKKIVFWNSMIPTLSLEECVHDLIVRECLKHPERLAIHAWDGELTYHQLDKLSTKLARTLATITTIHQTFVPLCFDKSMWTVVAMMGVMKAGGAFVLLDTSQPVKRLQAICQMVSAKIILSSNQNLPLSTKLAPTVLEIKDALAYSQLNTEVMKTPNVKPSDAVYAVFTSGSTGEPKCIIIDHAAYCTSAKAHSEPLYLDHTSRVLQFSSYTFDVSISDHLSTLITGGCICVPSQDERHGDIAGAINRMHINWAHLTPSVARLLQDYDLPTLKTLVLIGEPMNETDIATWATKLRLICSYGPAECSVVSAIQSEIGIGSDPANIGRPVGCTCWIVNQSLNKLSPIGAVGELVIQGPIVARGYLNDSEKTRTAFFENPPWLPHYTSDFCHRLYKTGDMVQYNSDGTLRFIGRKDTQVKLHGQRIELGEIEHRLRQITRGVQDVVVDIVLPYHGAPNSALAAFLWMREGLDGISLPFAGGSEEPIFAAVSKQFRTEITRLKGELKDLLPSYMIPAIFIPVKSIPLTKSGKTNRKQLRARTARFPQWAFTAYFLSDDLRKRPPKTAMEKELQRLIAEVLKLNREDLSVGDVNVDDNFFTLGGDSLSAIRLVTKAREHQLHLTVSTIFEYPEISRLAPRIHVRPNTTSATGSIPAFSLLPSNSEAREKVFDFAQRYYGLEEYQIEDIYPCTPTQEGLIAHTAKKAGSYISQFTYELPEDIDLSRFRKAWKTTVDANPILRTRIIHTSEGAFQVVVKGEISWTTPDNVDDYLACEVAESMPLGGPLLLLALGQRPPAARYLVLTLHHALYDGWSLPLILEQVEAAYQGAMLRERNFKGFINYIKGIDLFAAAEFWHSQFKDLDKSVFPALPSSAYMPVTNASVTYSTPLHMEMGVGMAFTISTILRLAWSIVISQYIGSSDVTFGVTLSGRAAPVEDVEWLTGPTITTVPLRIQLQSEQDIGEMLQSIQSQMTTLIPFEQIGLQKISLLGEEAAAACRFRSLLVVDPPPLNRKGERLMQQVSGIYGDQGDPDHYALIISCNVHGSNLNIHAAFDNHVIEEPQTQRILQQFSHIVHQIVRNPSLRLHELDLISAEDSAWLGLQNLNVPRKLNHCVHDLIRQRCIAQPHVQAICAWDGSMSYKELDQLSYALAIRLMKAGVVPDMFVPLCFEKSKWTTVAILGVMKSGGAFVLLDMSHPVHRLQTICRDLGATVTVSSPQWKTLSEMLAKQSLILAENTLCLETNEQWVPSMVKSHHAAYAVFTSGSTGKPKGIVIDHGAYCSSAIYHGPSLRIHRETRVLQFSRYAFDTSISDQLTTLIAGGCVCVPSETDLYNDITQTARQLQATHVEMTPSVARTLKPGDIPSLTTLVLSGEAMSHTDTDMWMDHVTVINSYGPAECSVTTTAHVLTDAMVCDPLCIGFPTGAVCWVVDQSNHNKLLPVGAIGELLIEGPIVGRGYLDDVERTEAAFVENPVWLTRFQSEGICRMYKTGDLVRFQTDGSLRFIGRKDRQVKLRGQRIELGEVEYYIRRHFQHLVEVIAEVVVGPQPDASPVLIAFIAEKNQPLKIGLGNYEEKQLLLDPTDIFRREAAEITAALLGTLPRYMVPSVFLPLGFVPFNRSGKIDRERLRKQSASLPRSALAAYASPNTKQCPLTPTEIVLCRLAASVLTLDFHDVGVNDSFFQLGADSIAAMRLVGLARDGGFQLSVADVFRHPRLCDLAGSMCENSQQDLKMIEPFSLLSGSLHDREESFRAIVDQCGVSIDQIEDIYPCTPLQEGLIALTTKKAESYIGQFTYELPGIDLNRFRQAWKTTLDANPILRTRIIQHPLKGMLQVVIKEDFGGIPLSNWDTLEDYITRDAAESMPLGGPLLRLALVPHSSSSSSVYFTLTIHHALYDGWSLSLILSQLEAAYKGVPLNGLIRQSPFNAFIDYIQRIDQSAAVEFWKSQFTGLNRATFPALPSATYIPTATASLTYSIPLVQSFKRDFTISTVVKLAWANLVFHYTGENDIVFGVTVAGRSAPLKGIESITGPVIATVPLRFQLQPSKCVAHALQNLQDQMLAVIPYEQMGLQNIAMLSEDAAAACQFQTLLVIQPPSEKPSGVFIPNPQASKEDADSDHYALTVTCTVEKDSLELYALFDPRVIDQAQMQRIMIHFSHIVNRLLLNPELTLEDISIIGPDDQAQLRQWNGQVPEPIDYCVHDLIRQQCLLQPFAQAICAWDGNFTYSELDELSSALAMHLLEKLDPKPDMFIPLFFEKSKWTTVAMLGVVKAGGAFVLLDSSYPVAYLQRICQEINGQVIMTSAKNAHLATQLCPNTVIVDGSLDAYYPPWTHQIAQPNSALYIAFTSGSTGNPKGVIIEHKAFCTSMKAHSAAMALTNQSRALQFASYAFDASIIESLSVLFSGGCICVPSDTDRHAIPESIAHLQVNWVCITPSVLRTLSPEEIPSVKTVVLVGEAISAADIARWTNHVQLAGGYGPAECAAISSVQPQFGPEMEPNRLGNPTGCVFWIVDRHDHNKLLPIGAMGELLIEGTILGREYLNDPRKTESSFIHNQTWLQDYRASFGVRLYKTGDLAQYNCADGTVKFIGRADTQVKLRGQRIELNGIEGLIAQYYPSLKAAVVEVVRLEGERQVLIAFLWTGNNNSDNTNLQQAEKRANPTYLFEKRTEQFETMALDIESRLRDVFPRHMIPSIYIPLKFLPLTKSGKTDRRRLKEQAAMLSETEWSTYMIAESKKQVLPSTPMERMLQDLIAQTLSVERSYIGINDNFFRLGGDSISVMRLIQAFSLLSDKSHQYMGDLIHTAATQCGIKADDIEDIYPCTPMQEGLMALTTKTGSYICQFTYELSADININRFFQAWKATLKANPILRTRIIQAPKGTFQVVIKDDIDVIITDDLNEYLTRDTAESMNLGDRLLRLALVQLSGNRHTRHFILTMHHALYDGWSLPLVLDQVQLAYRGDSLPERDFKGFVNYIKNLDTLAATEFWRSQFTDLNAPIFPAGSLHSVTDIHPKKSSCSYFTPLPDQSTSDFTIATLIKLAWALLLSQYTGENDVVFGLVTSGRSAPLTGIEQITGPTIATIPLRIQLELHRSISHALRKVQEQAAALIPHEHIGLQTIALLGEDAATACQFQNLLVIHPVSEHQNTDIFKIRPQGYDDEAGPDDYPLIVSCNLQRSSLDIHISFHEHVLDTNQIERILQQFSHTICYLLENPDHLLSEISVSQADSRNLRLWNGTPPESVDYCVHDLIKRHSLTQPTAPAVCAWDGNFTYGELDELSSAVATHLWEHSVQPDTFVPLCFEKSKWTIVAMLGVLKAGGAFVLLDSSYPLVYLRSSCQECRAHVVVTSKMNLQLARQLAQNVVAVDETLVPLHGPWTPGPTQTWIPEQAQPNNALYVTFTSGSTGKPKGVVVEHRAFCASMMAHTAAFFLDHNSRALQFASYAFDATIIETLSVLYVRGCICIPSNLERQNALPESIGRLDVNWVCLTPSVIRLMSSPREIPTVKTVVLVGEPISQVDIARWADIQLVGGYGPAECAAISAVQTFNRDTDPHQLGYPTSCRFWIVDRYNHDRLVPIGAIGELLLEGSILGREYLNDLPRTEMSFIYDPVWLQNYRPRGVRLYKTGDLVQYNSDGTLKFIGRADTQVKLRGQRIELDAIESFVREYVSSLMAVVVEVLRLPDSGRQVLVAFLWLGNSDGDDNDAKGPQLFDERTEQFESVVLGIESQLQKVLPRHMIPSAYIPLRLLPLTKTGKTDRRRLRNQAISEIDKSTYIIPQTKKQMPSTPMEKIFHTLVAGVLDLRPETIGINDDFFRLGGDSLAAMKLVVIAREEHGVHLTVSDIFRHRTLSKLITMSSTECNGDKEKQAISPFSLLFGTEDDRNEVITAAIAQCKVRLDQIEDIYPCTPLQEGLIALTAKTAGSYIGQFTCELPSQVNLDHFRQAWQDTIDANPILRTHIIQTTTQGMFQAVIKGEISWKTREGFSENENHEYVTRDGDESMHLGGPLLRLALAQRPRASGCSWSFILTIHHALYDGWSLPLILGQVENAYNSVPLPNKPFNRFIDYIMKMDSTATANFWRTQFANFNATVFPALPAANYVPVINSSLVHSIPIPIKRDEATVTMSMVIRLAWAISQSQYTASDDVIFGVIVNGRAAPVEEIEKMTGPTIATIPLRIKVQSQKPINEMLRSIHDQASAMIPFEQTGLQNIAHFGPESDAACRFQTLLVTQPPSEESNFIGSIGGFKGRAAVDNYALNISCTLQKGHVDIHATFDDHILDMAEMRRILHHFSHITKQILLQPDLRLESIIMISPEDLDQVWRWNKDLPRQVDCCVHDLICQQALNQPNAPAVCSWDGDLTYKELDDLSSTMAVSLASHGIGPEIFVPLCFEKSKWMTVAILAVMKAGGAYVPLDPSQPLKRLQGICRKVSANVIVSSTQNIHLSAELAPTVVHIADAAQETRENPRTIFRVKPTNAVYAVFTSGSTGEPKGIVIEHAAYCTSAMAHIKPLCLDRTSRVLQFSSYAFDICNSDHLSTLIAGGCICVPSEDERNNDIIGALNHMQVNWALLTPSVARLLSSYRMDTPTFKTLVLTGEPMSDDDIAIWTSRLHLLSSYGPAECSMVSTVRPDITSQSDPATIGRAAGCICWVVDQSNGKLAPIGGIGELVIEGPIVARGYLNEIEKTRTAFPKTPAWRQNFRSDSLESCRLYKTGDLVQYNSDGTLRYIGRKDTQVKLRGQRIELSEVEFHTRHCFHDHDVVDVVAEIVTPEWTCSAPTLMAFVYSKSDHFCKSGPSTQEEIVLFAPPTCDFRLRVVEVEKKLQELLPAYMLPSAFVPLHFLPLTVSGKIDRKRLRQQAASLSRSIFSVPDVEKQPPSTPTEKLIQDLFAKVLSLPPGEIGVGDSFFRLGGDSIAAMKLVSLAGEHGLRIRVVDVFNSPTLSNLASSRCAATDIPGWNLSGREASSQSANEKEIFSKTVVAPRIGVTIDDISDVLITTYYQQLMLREVCRYFIITLDGALDRQRLRSACQVLVDEHPILRTLFINIEGIMVQVVLATLDAPVNEHQTSCTADHLAKFLSADTRQRPVNLGTIPLEFTLLCESAVRHALVIRFSHAQYDGLSLPVLCDDLATAYKGQIITNPKSFPQYLKQCKLLWTEEASSFWARTLKGASMTYLPSGHEPGSGSVDRAILRIQNRLSLLSRPIGITIATLVKAAWSLVLMQITRQRDVVFGQLVSGRSSSGIDAEKVVGPCVNIVPIRVRHQADGSLLTFLQMVQQQHVDSIEFESARFEDIVANCTDWSSETFGSVLHHVDIGEKIQFSIDHIDCTGGIFSELSIPDDIWITSTLRHFDLEIDLLTSNWNLSPDLAEDLVLKLCDTIHTICSDPEKPLCKVFPPQD